MVPTMTRCNRSSRTGIWIADTRPADYDGLGQPTDDPPRVCFLRSAREVLRRWRAAQPAVCLINVDLPDLCGFDLAAMLRPFPQGTTVCLVDDRYVMEDEVRALGLGVHRYLCKPLSGDVLSEVCSRREPHGTGRRCLVSLSESKENLK